MLRKVIYVLLGMLVMPVAVGVLAAQTSIAQVAEPARAAASDSSTTVSNRLAAYHLQDRLQRAMAKAEWWKQIVRRPSGQLHHEYLIPGAGYHQLFDWDTYFMGVALSYAHRGKSLAGSVEDFLHLTDHHASYRGYTPREVGVDHLWALPEMCKPFLAQMALRASLTLHSGAWLKPYYARLADTLW